MKLAREKVIIICGIWLVILPFTGFPRGWKTFLTVLTGMAILFIGGLLWRDARLAHPDAETRTKTFTETA